MHRGPAYRLARTVLRPFVRSLTRRTWHEPDHLPAEGGVVLAANHLSFLDPLVVGYFVDDRGREPRFLAKAELFSVPVVGRVLRSAGQIPVHRRTSAAVRAYAQAVTAVERGECVVVYPEGTLTHDPELWPMRGRFGAARVALATRAPLVPMAQWGIHRTLAPRTRRLRLWPRARVEVLLGPPVPLADLYERGPDDADAVAEATERLMSAITGLLERLRGESAPPERFDAATMAPGPRTGRTRRAARRAGGEERRRVRMQRSEHAAGSPADPTGGAA